jgi:Protein of unknown function DUF45
MPPTQVLSVVAVWDGRHDGVPQQTSREEVERILAEKRSWIEEQRRRQVPRLGLDRLALSESEARIAARDLVTVLAEEEAERVGVAYQRIRIGGQRTLWGSCSARGTLSFNWRLVLAPPEVLDYGSCTSSVTCVFRTTRDGSGRSSSDIARTGASCAAGCVTMGLSSSRSALTTDRRRVNTSEPLPATGCRPPPRWPVGWGDAPREIGAPTGAR